jgi:hypothetical protein
MTIVLRDILPERLPDDYRFFIGDSGVIVVIGKVCNQVVLDFGFMVRRIERTRNVITEFQRKRVCILSLRQNVVIKLMKNVLNNVKLFRTSVLSSVFGASFEPLTFLSS